MFALALFSSILTVICLYAWGIFDTYTEQDPLDMQVRVAPKVYDDWFIGDHGEFSTQRAKEPKARWLHVLKTYVLREYQNREPSDLQVQVGATIVDMSTGEVFNTVLKDDYVSRMRLNPLDGPKDVTHRLIGSRYDSGQHVRDNFLEIREPSSPHVEDWVHDPYGTRHEVRTRLVKAGVCEPTNHYPSRSEVDVAEVENLYEVDTADSEAATRPEVIHA